MSRFGQPEMPKVRSACGYVLSQALYSSLYGWRARLCGTASLLQVSAETRAAFSQDLLLKAQRKIDKTNKRAEFKDRLEKAAQEAVSMLYCCVCPGHAM